MSTHDAINKYVRRIHDRTVAVLCFLVLAGYVADKAGWL
jgi:hypothetical protein